MNFDEFFKKLTDQDPFSWQRRLYEDYFKIGNLPKCVKVYTGFGKTMIIPIWLITRILNGDKVPRRLIYVVDRRNIIDQSTTIVEKIIENTKYINDFPKINVSTLRGQKADNREWTRDPTDLSIIIGTVDLIGSSILFSGYRSGFRKRPLETGFLGQDSLIVLDEAHLSAPFEKLICSISQDGQFQRDKKGNPCGSPLKVIRMSATITSEKSEKVFKISGDVDEKTGDFSDEDVCKRFATPKELIIENEVENVNETMAEWAVKLANGTTEKAGERTKNSRVVVYRKSPVDAKKILDIIKKSKIQCAILTGRIRGYERDEMIKPPIEGDKSEINTTRTVMKRFIDPVNTKDGPVILVSTSAGEVGFDLNADHEVLDEAPLDSLIQRFGRVGRRGDDGSVVVLVREKAPEINSEFDQACLITSELIKQKNLEDVCPESLNSFQQNLSEEELKNCLSPKPKTLDLTNILLDSWSMTSIPHSASQKKEVGPWLKGINGYSPIDVDIAWRWEVSKIKDIKDEKIKREVNFIKKMFNIHRIRSHELLTVKKSDLIDMLKKAVKKDESIENNIVVVKFSNENVQIKSVKDVINKSEMLNSEPTLVFSDKFGELEHGMLSGFSNNDSLDIADIDGYEYQNDDPTRMRIVFELDEDGFGFEEIISKNKYVDKLEFGEEKFYSRSEISDILEKSGLKIRGEVKFDRDSDGKPKKILLSICGIKSKNKKPKEELYESHIESVEKEAERIYNEINLTEVEKDALVFAAKYHDKGKLTELWQKYIGGSMEKPLAKSYKYCNPRLLAGYRHEYGSVLRAKNNEISDDAFELALHLIATHHGWGRPHFKNPIDPEIPKELVELAHIDSMNRFARLQIKYGWWRLCWLENLLRCADHIASEQIDMETEEEEENDYDS